MSKFTDFYKKAAADEAAKKEMTAILGSKALNEATDEELAKVGKVAKKLGVDITAEEMKAFVSGNAELDEDDLEAAAGGMNAGDIFRRYKEEHGGSSGQPAFPDYLKYPDPSDSEGQPKIAPIGTPWWL